MRLKRPLASWPKRIGESESPLSPLFRHELQQPAKRTGHSALLVETFNHDHR